jgi:hypothetical protein
MQQISQHEALGRGQIAVILVLTTILGGFFLMLDDFFFQLLTQRGFMIPSEYQSAQALPYSTVSIVVGS